jgi:hypothetical protein
MIRRALFELLLFLLPFALYAVYLKLAKEEPAETKSVRAHPWTVLFVSGLLLVAASFLIWGIQDGAGQQGVYVPPHVEDGRVVPGQVVPDGGR